MQVLIHIGLNKCASTYIQNALAGARNDLAAAGVCYPDEGDRHCHYSVSSHYGFGPGAAEVVPRSIAEVLDNAANEGFERVILSSEYLSLNRPRAADRLVADLDRDGCDVTFLMFSRNVPDWVRSLFNQYVRTNDGGRYLPDIDAFVDQILGNGACDIAARYRMWAQRIGAARLRHYRIRRQDPRAAVLHPFAAFAGVPIKNETTCADNRSIGPDALYHIGRLRQRPPGPKRDAAIAGLLAGGHTDVSAPDNYLRISADNRARLEEQVIAPYRMLPVRDLGDGPTGPADLGVRVSEPMSSARESLTQFPGSAKDALLPAAA